ncbi:MAG: serine/threonine protein kinase [Myxococcales bacterium]|nr:serine/threonine protein kinase [Myxococcales bacterium]
MQEAMTKSEVPQRGPEVGSVVAGRFVLLELLGEGDTARVFRADDRQSGRQIALKLLLARHRQEPHEYRLLDEGEYLRRIGTSKHVVGLIESGQADDHDGWPFVALELLEGRTLRQHELDAQALPLVVALSHARQIAKALDDCHRANVVHRDLTPANLMVSGDPSQTGCTIRLFDFSHAGSAAGPRLPPGHPDRLTSEFEIIGTSGFIPPEQARAHPAATGMDVYAYGAVLWELLTGSNPLASGTAKEFIAKQRGDGVPVPKMPASARIPESLAQLVNDCLVSDVKLRPSMSAVLERLEDLYAETVRTQLAERPLPVEDRTDAIPPEKLARARSSAFVAAGASAPKKLSLAPIGESDAPTSDKTGSISPEELARMRSGAHVAAGDKTDAISAAELARVRAELQEPAGIVEEPPRPAFARENAPPIDWHDLPDSDGDEFDLDTPRSPSRAWVPVVLLLLLVLGGVIWWFAWGRDESSAEVAAVESKSEASPKASQQQEPSNPEPKDKSAPSEPEPAEIAAPEPEEPEPIEPETTDKDRADKLDHRSSYCAKVRGDAEHALETQQWSKADRLARRSACWSSSTERLRIRVKALAQSERYADCVRAGESQSDKEIQKWVNICRRALP